jgi:hypothetical protein
LCIKRLPRNVPPVTTNAERYRRLFGIDPQTLERIG